MFHAASKESIDAYVRHGSYQTKWAVISTTKEVFDRSNDDGRKRNPLDVTIQLKLKWDEVGFVKIDWKPSVLKVKSEEFERDSWDRAYRSWDRCFVEGFEAIKDRKRKKKFRYLTWIFAFTLPLLLPSRGSMSSKIKSEGRTLDIWPSSSPLLLSAPSPPFDSGEKTTSWWRFKRNISNEGETHFII